MYLYIPSFVLALIMVIILYGKIALLAYKARNSNMAPMTTNDHSGSQNKNTKVISLVVGVFMVTYVALIVGYIAREIMTDELSYWIRIVAFWIWQVSKSNSLRQKIY